MCSSRVWWRMFGLSLVVWERARAWIDRLEAVTSLCFETGCLGLRGYVRRLDGRSRLRRLCQWVQAPLFECLQGCTTAKRTACFFAELLFTTYARVSWWILAKKSFLHLWPRPPFLCQPPTALVSLLFTQCCPTAKMAPVRRAPYKDFLQPALHRRFTSTATILLAIAFVEAVVLSSWDSRQLCPSLGIYLLSGQSANIVHVL